MNVLVACEFSGIVRDAFIRCGHSALSCDLLPTESPGPHYQGDIRDILESEKVNEYDLMIAHPPCTYLAASGARWWAARRQEQKEALEFVRMLMACKIPKIAIENPIGLLSTVIRKPDQIIQPWQFGHGETKATCLWLKGLPLLTPTNIADGRIAFCHHVPPGVDRWRIRSRTYRGIAAAMAQQWGKVGP